MGDVGFGKDFSNLTTGIEHPAIAQIHKHMSILGVFQTLPWLMNILGSIPGAASSFAEFFEFCAKQMQEKKDEYSREKNPKDVASWLVKAVIEKDVSASPTPQSLADDSRSLIIAGSDTTANTLAIMLYYLTVHPQKLQKLQSLIALAIPGGPSAWTYEAIKTVTYIDDIINETLRLKPPVIHGGPRETPAKGLHIGDVYIPGNVTVSVPYLLVQRDPRWWKDAEDFVPERFGERRVEMGTEEAPWLPFTLGTYHDLVSSLLADWWLGMHACAGKALAYMILRTSLSLIVQNFDVSFAPGETGETFDTEFLDTFLLALPPLSLVFTPRVGI
jgi:cytochrome P450